MNKIIPTIIAKNQKEMNSLIKEYKPFKTIQLDIMDGKWVEQKSNWFNFNVPKTHTYEAHLMVQDPEAWIQKNYTKVQTIIANIEEVKDPKKLIQFLKSKKKKVGFALNPETPITLLQPYLKEIDQVLLLSVHPGKYGAQFIPEVIKKISQLRMRYSGNIEIDGHMNPETIKRCKEAGANMFAVGSFLKDSSDKEKTKKILEQIN